MARRRGGGGGGRGGSTASNALTNLTAEQKSVYQTLMPYLSPEDISSSVSTYGLTPPSVPSAPPTEITGSVRNAYLSQERALQAINALTGTKAKGPGAEFLKNAMGLLKQYGGAGGEGMSRANYVQFANQFSSLMNAARNNAAAAPYTALAQMFLSPSFSSGELVRQTKSGFGAPEKKLYV